MTKPAAHDALVGRGRARPGLGSGRIGPLSAEQDLIWRAVLALFGDLGRAPRPTEVVGKIGLPLDSVLARLLELQEHDLLAMDHEASTIAFAYPFTERATAHRVGLHGRSLNALCAIDALAVGCMYRTDVAVASSCSYCGTHVEIGTANGGRSVRRAAAARDRSALALCAALSSRPGRRNSAAQPNKETGGMTGS